MPTLAPFRALRYDTAVVGDLAKVVAPPYDVISPADQEALYAAHPENVVRLILAKEGPAGDRYQSAARDYAAWLTRGVLKVDPEPAFYLYAQQFTLPTGEEHTRKGLIALVRLEDPGKGVKAHEKTLAAPREDRFRLMMATGANFSQVFALYRDPDRRVAAVIDAKKGEPIAQCRITDGIRHTLWRITDAEAIRAAAALLCEQDLIIADGHHRYETALRYRDEMRAKHAGASPRASFEYMTFFLCDSGDPGLVILPTHRQIRKLEGLDVAGLRAKLGEHFRVTERLIPPPTPAGTRSVLRLLAEAAEQGPSFAVIAAGQPSMLVATLKQSLDLGALVRASPAVQRLDVTVLHSLCLERILAVSPEAIEKTGALGYVKDTGEALAQSRSGEVALTFLLPPTRIEQVFEVARAGERMPQKSTFFYPKILSGLVMRKIDPAEVVAEP